jgi:hypothetical protein
MLSSNNIVELTITNDSFVIKGIDWDLKFRDPNQGFISRTIEKKVIANGNVYLYLTSPKETVNHLSIATITIVAPKTELIVTINSIDSSFTDTSYMSKDANKKYGFIFYSEPEIQRLQNQKSIELMSIEDFNLYASKLLKSEVEIDSLSKMSNSPNISLNLKFSMLRNIIGQIGYNPLLTNRQLSEFINRFYQKKETKEISKKLFSNFLNNN